MFQSNERDCQNKYVIFTDIESHGLFYLNKFDLNNRIHVCFYL